MGLLDLKVLGRQPDALEESVRPTIDLTRAWLNRRAVFNTTAFSVTLTTGGSGLSGYSGTPILVPDTEVWFVHHYTINYAHAAAAGESVVNLRPALLYNATGTSQFTTFSTAVSSASDAVRVVRGAVDTHDFWALPGHSLALHVQDIVSAAGIAFTGRFLATRLMI